MNSQLNTLPTTKRIAIVGGGLAGLAAAWALSDPMFQIDLFEAKRRCGGRAGSFFDPVAQSDVDYCQHVAMGCCTNFRKLISLTELEPAFSVTSKLTFLHADHGPSKFQRKHFLPPPLDLVPDFLRFKFLPWKERLKISYAMLRLMRPGRVSPHETMARWLRRHHQTEIGIRDFWNVILASALGEDIDQVAFKAARKVFIDGFLSHRTASDILIPLIPLSELFGQQIPNKLAKRGVCLHLNTSVRQIDHHQDGRLHIELSTPQPSPPTPYDAVVLAVPWHSIERLFPKPETYRWIPNLRQFSDFPTAPISGIHLWLDRLPTTLPHAVIVDRLSQWIFQPQSRASELPSEAAARFPHASDSLTSPSHYLQVVVSASRGLRGRSHQEILHEVLCDFNKLFPTASPYHLIHGRVVTDPNAVFSITPNVDALRPPCKTQNKRLFLAGDWVQTGWPATMEGAVKSGFEAAEKVFHLFDIAKTIVAPPL